METERKRAFIIHAVYFCILAACAGLVVLYVLPKLAPFVVGFLVAYLLRRPTHWLSQRLRLPYRPLALLLALLFYCTIGLLIGLLLIRAFSGLTDLLELAPHVYTVHLEPTISALYLGFEELVLRMDPSLLSVLNQFYDQLMAWLGTLISGVSAWAVGAASGAATAIPGLFLKLVLMLISTFFIAMDYDRLTAFCLRQLPENGKALFFQIKNYLVGTLLVCIGSYAIIICLTFVELAIGLSLIGIQHAVILAALISVFDILPVLGTGGIMIPWGIITLLQGNISTGVKLLLVYVAVTVIRNIVEPKIVGSQLGLHPVVTLASMFLGVQLMGVAGLFGFPIALSLLRYLNDNGSIRIFKAES